MAFGGGVYPKIVLQSDVLPVPTWTFADEDNLIGYQLDFPQVRFSKFGPTQDGQHAFTTRFGGRYLSAKLTLSGANNDRLVAFLHKLATWRDQVLFYPAPGVLTWPNSSRDSWLVNVSLPDMSMLYQQDATGRVRTARGHDLEIVLEGYEEMTDSPQSHLAEFPIGGVWQPGVAGRCIGGLGSQIHTDSYLGPLIGYGRVGTG